MRYRVKLGVVLFLLNFVPVTIAALELELTQGVEGAIPIGVNAFEAENLLKSSLSDVIQNDLTLSGRFHVTRGGQLLENWRQHGIETILSGRIEKSMWGSLQVNFELLDPVKNYKLISHSFAVKPGFERKLAHHIADLIYEKLTGDKGFFSTKLAYIVTERHQDGKIFHNLEVADSDGFNAKIILRSTQPLMSPTWSQDGESIAFVSFENRRSSIYKLNVKTGNRKLITQFPGINGAPAWSPDGKQLAIVLSKSGHPKVYVLSLRDKSLTQKTFGISIDTEPAFAPDGNSLVFTSDRGGTPQIYRLWLDTNKIERVSFVGNYNARASFTPDGNAIVMLNRQGGMFNIAMQNLLTGEVNLLTQTGQAESPTVSPNGKMVMYASSLGERGILNLVSTDGRVKLRLPSRDGDVQEPAWSPYLG